MVMNKCYKKVKGDKGPIGDTGDKGDKGNRGPRGDRGPIGDKGEVGSKGDKGDKGPRGYKGPVGPVGPIGDRGLKGATGAIGDKGDMGEIGDQGEKGNKGFEGPIGDKGDKGPQGAQGDRGQTGPIGERGPIGADGLKGPIGDKGETGDDGEVGPTGKMGNKGRRGDAGPRGPWGDTGIQGNIGFAGLDNYAIPMPGEIIMKKVLKYIQNKNLQLTVALDTPANVNLEGIGGIARITKIAKIEFDCLYLSPNGRDPIIPGNLVIPIGNIQAVNVEYNDNSKNIRDSDIQELKNLFQEIVACDKNAPQTVPLDANGEPTETGNLALDYEYVLDCTCNGRECTCLAKKIDLCRYAGYESNYLSISMESFGKRGLKVKRIITRSGEDITNYNKAGGVTFDTSMEIGPRCISSIITFYTYQNLVEGGLTTKHGWTFINLDKALVVEYNN